MTKRRRGRPAKTEHDLTGEILWLEELMQREQTAMLQAGLRPKKVLLRAAARLDISERSAKRLKAEMKRVDVDLSKTWLGDWLRQLKRDDALKKNSGTDLLALDCCSSD
jgi:hypothetical protein